MFDILLERLTSPNSRRRHTYHCPEIHSDPEDCEPVTPSRKPRLLERRKKGRKVDSGLRQARSLGRLDGLKEVSFSNIAEKLTGYIKVALDGYEEKTVSLKLAGFLINQITLSKSRYVVSTTCACPRGIKCHHIITLALFGHYNISVTDKECAKVKKCASKDSRRTVSIKTICCYRGSYK